MKGEFDHLPGNESIKDENDFLKMKLMLERGASFGKGGNEELSAEMENEFLKNIIEFEKQFEEHKTIKVFDKIGKPGHFKPVAEVSDLEIENAWEDLSAHLDKYGISLDVCSPNISVRELYRFVIEELFEYEMDDMDIPGMVHGFIYDEFHPDPVYENSTAAEDDCIKQILCKDPVNWLPHFKIENIRLNNHYPLTEAELKKCINNFKDAYDTIECTDISELKCEVNERVSMVTGNYTIKFTFSGEAQIQSGKWLVVFETDDNYYWYINNVQIEKINF